jgi:oxalate decarboxylase
VTQNFAPGDVGYIKRAYGHFLRNTGNTDLIYLEVFKSRHFAEVSLSDWLSHTPASLVAQHLNVNPQVIESLPKSRPAVMPA